jgi:hypothetical protein
VNTRKELKLYKRNIALARAMGEHGSEAQQADCRCIMVCECDWCGAPVGEPCQGDTGALVTTHWPRRRVATLMKYAQLRREKR